MAITHDELVAITMTLNARNAEIERQATEIERLNKELLERDFIWLPEKDAEIERLRAAMIGARASIDAGWSCVARQTIDAALEDRH